jgi:hypothetical protein
MSNNALTIVFFLGKILPNVNMKNMILNYAKGYFMEKNDPNFPDFYDNFQ